MSTPSSPRILVSGGGYNIGIEQTLDIPATRTWNFCTGLAVIIGMLHYHLGRTQTILANSEVTIW